MSDCTFVAITGGPDSDKDGKPGVQEDRRVEHIIPPSAVQAGNYTIYIEVSCNGMFGVGTGGYRYQIPDVRFLFFPLLPFLPCFIAVPGRTDRLPSRTGPSP